MTVDCRFKGVTPPSIIQTTTGRGTGNGAGGLRRWVAVDVRCHGDTAQAERSDSNGR